MPSEKFKVNKTDRSIRHAAKNFFGTFSVSPNGLNSTRTTTTISYPLVGGIDSIHEDPESHLDRRSAHNALERQRREILNAKFQELAHALPSLQTVRRPSKTMIVAKSLDYVCKSMQRETNYVNQIKELRKQNERLRKQAKISKALVAKHQQQQSSSGIKKKSKSVMATARPCTPPHLHSSSTESSFHYHQQLSPPLTPEAPNKHYIMDMKPAFPAQSTMAPPPPPPTTTTTAAAPTWTDPTGLMANYYTSPPSNMPPMVDNDALMTLMMQWPSHQTEMDKGDNTMLFTSWPEDNTPHYNTASFHYIA